MPRSDSRSADQLRPIEYVLDVAPHAKGSVLIAFGNTKVICAASISDEVPRWMKVQNVPGGWLTAEYSMLPYSTLDRKERDSFKGRPDGRSIEIQRLIGRSLRAVVDLKKLGQRTLHIDCDVLQADGGTRTAAITGACIAASIACNRLLQAGKITQQPIPKKVAAVSVGIVKGEALLDLCYVEDVDAEVDSNIVMTDAGEFVEVQGSGEEAVFTQAQLDQMLILARKGIAELTAIQNAAIEAADKKAPSPASLQSLAAAFAK
jgi:ribonuclease PH